MSLKSISFLILFLTSLLSIKAQQITVDNTLSPQDLIQNTLIQGCVEVSNIASPSNGNIVGLGSFGYFDRGSSSFPFENGIVLTTGNANSAGNGQNTAVLNEGDLSWTGDADLEATLGISETLNATSITFDFISITNQIEFNYIFASEEYFGNFPCSNSDGLAFLIREAGSTDPFTNIALIPGTTTPVNANTIHAEIFGFCEASNEAYFEGYNVGNTNYNGITEVLTARATIQPNVQYEIKLVIADLADENYDSAVFIEVNSFNASVNLGEDFSTCATSTVLDADIENPNANYSWFYNNAAIPSANQSTLNAVQSGNYRVEIEIPFTTSACIIQDEINIVLSSTQSSDPIPDFDVCDDLSNDGFATFDLSTKDADVLASVPASNYTISYHLNNVDSFNNFNPITNPIQNTSNPQTIHVRIQDTNTGCLAFSTITLNVFALPTIVDPTPLVLCDDQTADGSTSIDLNALKDDEIIGNQTNLVVTYHNSASDASATINAITMPYVNTNANEELYVSVTNSLTGCNSTTTLDLTILETPAINDMDLYIDACDPNSDFSSFDLTAFIPEVIQGLTNVSVTFHRTENEALSGSNPIIDENNFQNTSSGEQVLFIRVEHNTSGCASIAQIEIHTNLLLTATDIEDITVCDTGNDGTEEFNFETIETNIVKNIPNVTVKFYESETDRINQSNEINPAIPYNSQSNPQTIYLTLETPTCSDEAEIELILAPIINFNSVVSLTACDDDQDGLTTIDLSSFDEAVTDGMEGFSVSYFLTEEDANNNENVLPTLYENTTTTFTLFPRVNFDETDCADINSFQVEVLPAPLSETPEAVIICDADRDGFFNINLNNSIPTSISSAPNRIVTFHNNENDANIGANAITNTLNYNAQTEIVYMRVENSLTGCHTLEELEVFINTLPYVGDLTNLIEEYNFCEDETDGIGEFIFETKDTEALDGQTGKEVSYYLTPEDADAKVNALDKTSIYQNTSNPQEIFIRIDNITDESCYTTSSFFIEVGTNPEFNDPVDLFVCDDISNDGSEIFDLTTKIIEVSAGIPDIQNVTFYATEEDARNSINAIPLQFANTVNPQEIFVQIDNGTICNSIASFVVNVIPVPDISPVPPITECDTDFDGFTIFDLTIAELSILDVRQEGIDVAYYESFEDSESNSNAITSPENYLNLSNPQTVYIKVTNTLSECYASYPVDLVVNQPPVINDFDTFSFCSDTTGIIDLTDINLVVSDVNFNVIFRYFSNEADAIANTNPLDSMYSYITDNDTLFVRATFSTTQCFDYYEFNLRVNPLPIANLPNSLVACDDDFDGQLEFDLQQQNSSILGVQDPNLFTVTYHNSLFEANESISPLNLNYTATNNEIIYVRLENSNTGCYDITEFSILINPLPQVDVDDQVICLDNLPLVVSTNTNILTDQYLWSTGETSSEIEIFETGSYSITITNALGCENTHIFEVTESESATIDFTEVIDFSDPNNITVSISGIGNYLYQLDDNEPQESNVFENVGLGYHTVTILDLNGCANVTKEVLVIDVPKFFTPNNDGAFDTWHIVGVETLPGTTINIFDRYGKFLIKLTSSSEGWDGSYNGSKLPASDYWFVARVKSDGTEFELKGNFSLRR
jgi:gliding motility-associated-like protein